MLDPLLAAAEPNDMWYALPLVISVSLVYSATRHERVRPMIAHAARIAAWITGFMLVIFVVLLLVCCGL